MSDITTKLEYLNETKNLIRKAIISKNVSVSKNDTFRSYADKIEAIPVTAEVDVSPLEIIENDEYDAGEGRAYNPITVNVQPKLKEFTVENNGIYKVSDEEDPTLYGYSKVTVDVDKHLMIKSITSEDLPEDLEDEIVFKAKDEVADEDKTDPDKAVYGYSEFKMDLRGVVGEKEIELDVENAGEQITFEANDDNLYGYSKFIINIIESEGPFDVEFWNEKTRLQTVSVQKNQKAEYTGETPTKKGMIFSGWNPNPLKVDRDLKCYAQFKKGKAITTEEGEIVDSWASIAANGGVDIEIGSWKTLYVESFTYNNQTINSFGLKMIKVASGEGGTGSTWLSDIVLPFFPKFYNNEETVNVSDSQGWATSDLRTFLNTTFLQAILNSPDEQDESATIGQAIKTVEKVTKVFDRHYNSMRVVRSYDQIWMPSAYEIGYSGYEGAGTRYHVLFAGGHIVISDDEPTGRLDQLGFALRTDGGGYSASVILRPTDNQLVIQDSNGNVGPSQTVPAFWGNGLTDQILRSYGMADGDILNAIAYSLGDGGVNYWYVNPKMSDATQRNHHEDPGNAILHNIRIGFCT